MTLPLRGWTFPLVAVLAAAQEPAPFTPEAAGSWKPAWELTFAGDRLSDPGYDSASFRRANLRLRLRWSWELAPLRLEAGTRTALGSDGNRFNPPRWDQQPSNGTQLDLARASVAWVSERAFATLGLGLQESGLIASQALWDRDLRYLGAGARVGFRGAGAVLQEAGLRVAAGRVQTLLGGRADLAAGQVVVKVDTGPWSWVAHAGRWDLAWTSGGTRLRPLPGHEAEPRQRMAVEAGGLSTTWNAAFPWSARWFGSRNPATRDTSEEAQLVAGSRERIYWPQVALTWQRLSSTGTLYPVNGDEWWFYRRARGPRLEVALPLPGQWVVAVTHLRQRADGEPSLVTRNMVVLTKRF